MSVAAADRFRAARLVKGCDDRVAMRSSVWKRPLSGAGARDYDRAFGQDELDRPVTALVLEDRGVLYVSHGAEHGAWTEEREQLNGPLIAGSMPVESRSALPLIERDCDVMRTGSSTIPSSSRKPSAG